MSENGKGDKRRPQVIDPRQMELNWDRTFHPDAVSQGDKWVIVLNADKYLMDK